MKKFIFKIFCAANLVIGAFLICSATEGAEMQVNGRLYFSVSDGVYELNLSTQQRRYVYKNSTLFGGQLAYVNEGRFVAGASGHLLLVEPSGLGRELTRGDHPVFNARSGKILFFSGHGLAEPRPRLFSGEIDLKEGVKAIQQVDSGPFGVADSPLQISSHEVVYRRDGIDNYLYKFDFVTNLISELSIKNCRPLAWRTSTNQIVCARIGTNSYFSTSIDGNEIVELPQLKDIAVGPYLPSDKLLGSRLRLGLSGEESELVVYSFDTGKVQKLADHVPISPGTAFWIP